MNRSPSLVLLTVLLLSILASNSFAQTATYSGVFSEDFDGTALDSANWVVQENTNISGNAAYGGTVKVENGSLYLSSDGSGFPCVTSAINPFPTSGDFTVEFNFTYTRIGDWGNGLWFSKGPFIVERGTPSANVFQLWPHNLDYDQSAILIYLLGTQVHRAIIYGWLPSAPTMNFKLQYQAGSYTLFMDGIQVATAESDLRPDIIGIGHPPAYYIPFIPPHVKSVMGGWSSTKFDYIKLLQQSGITLSTSASSTQLGFNVAIDGILQTTLGEPISGANIVISSRVAGDSQWNAISSATTNSNGAFNATWNPSATGVFNLKATWNGNGAHSGSAETKDLSVTRPMGQALFYAESNSTLSSLAFNSTSNEASFTVSGPSGTTGYVKFIVSKSLSENMTALKVLLDGRELNFTVTSIDDSWQLYFVYSHSMHAVTIKMPASAAPVPSVPDVQPSATESVPEFTTVALLVLFAACSLSALVLVKRRRS